MDRRLSIFVVLGWAVLFGFGMNACSRKEPVPNESAATEPPVASKRVKESVGDAEKLDGEKSAAPEDSFENRVRSILTSGAPMRRRQALDDLGGALATHDPARAAAILKQIMTATGPESGEVYAFVSGFTGEYAAIDPAAAAVWAESLPLTLKFSAYTFVAHKWSEVDLASATTWAEQIAEPSLRSSVLHRMSEVLEKVDEPKIVAEWAQRIAELPDAAQHAAMIGRLWAKSDAEGAFEWSMALEDSTQQTTAVVAIAAAVAEQDPLAAAAWVEQFPTGPMRSQAAASASARWSENDPAAAARWIGGLGDEQLLETAIHSVARRWLEKDRAQAAQWIRNAPLSLRTKRYLLNDESLGGG